MVDRPERELEARLAVAHDAAVSAPCAGCPEVAAVAAELDEAVVCAECGVSWGPFVLCSACLGPADVGGAVGAWCAGCAAALAEDAAAARDVRLSARAESLAMSVSDPGAIVTGPSWDERCDECGDVAVWAVPWGDALCARHGHERRVAGARLVWRGESFVGSDGVTVPYAGGLWDADQQVWSADEGVYVEGDDPRWDPVTGRCGPTCHRLTVTEAAGYAEDSDLSFVGGPLSGEVPPPGGWLAYALPGQDTVTVTTHGDSASVELDGILLGVFPSLDEAESFRARVAGF